MMAMEQALTREQFCFLNCIYNVSMGRTATFADVYQNTVMEKTYLLRELVALGYIEPRFERITQAGLDALEPYRVQRAVILAAGASERCIPLSLEQPKGLFEVKGERLIERQIQQLNEAGICDITIVLGYKKEKFYYLRDKYNVTLIENDKFLTLSNIHSLYLARDYLADAYICSCDDYFVENPFHRYEYCSFYAGVHVDKPTEEMYVYVDEDHRIVKMADKLQKGLVVLGHSFWQAEFAAAFIAMAEEGLRSGQYANAFWEWMVKDTLDAFRRFITRPMPHGRLSSWIILTICAASTANMSKTVTARSSKISFPSFTAGSRTSWTFATSARA